MLHTVMEIRNNPYEDDFVFALKNDKTVELGESPFENENRLGGNLAAKD